ncbi:hypothetical protein Harman_00550 [Haloarcula mannanilytica]|uniref:DUF8163 domain-containing protein n=1 Tax=Haloarcula mannanilytica TaxID=2509225 RepID=A0A4C2EFU3_9EURY|nr:hypothetical protein [Haloarcula mannanilytica]GCF12120.1 hypothetical protein Harman_00550 [Haloarcula mannanilytica]
MSLTQGTRERPRDPLPTGIGLLGIIAATSGLVLGGPTWLVFTGIVLGGLYLLGTPVLAVVFGQIGIVAVDAPSLLTLALVEGGLLVTLLSMAVRTPDGRVAGSLVAGVVPLLGGVAWLSLWQWNLEPLLVGSSLLSGAAVVGYLLHRYLLIDLDIVTADAASDSDIP